MPSQQNTTRKNSDYLNELKHGKYSYNTSANKPPQHLSEFYSFMSNNSNASASPGRELTRGSYEYNQRMNREPSLNTFTSFSPSVSDLSNILTSQDFQHTTEKYSNIIDKAEKLRLSLAGVCEAASEFGHALEDSINECPKVNNSKNVSNGIMNAGGLQHIIAANQNILSSLILLSFEQPLRKELQNLQEEYSSNYKFYQQEVKSKSNLLKEKELENLKLSKSKTRNLNTYKINLLSLTNQIDDIDRLKYEYYHEINSMIENFNRDHLLVRTGSLVRAHLEIYEGIAKKGWSGGGLDELLAISPDLFGTDYTDEEDEQLEDEARSKNNEISHERISAQRDNSRSLSEADSDSQIDDTDNTIELSKRSQSANLVRCNTEVSKKISHELEGGEEHNLGNCSQGDSTQDESFSLPAINNSNTVLNQSAKLLDSNSTQDNDISIDNNDILNELDE
ncbi:uncharacterized protein AC631_05723 [Debaryomyces fabryi]|uniref:IMD domain-containing protein n=1 Tax=Debaryomyces fabryi TaxID=58627 RepID=A0A0V1PQV3_9ASCO|nr:uncharacterized protein AC631_05723 [Debaryomyces fabryi]KRZ98514.1 hypothetical protein AC631_05723 [Debaryomyces fabryi]CUM48992.1 unnamed protein product [Debaryomyces fabryi]